MPNVPDKCQALAGVPSCDQRTTTGNGGYGSSAELLSKNLPGYGRNLVTSGKPWDSLPITTGNWRNEGKAWPNEPEGPISHGGQLPKAV